MTSIFLGVLLLWEFSRLSRRWTPAGHFTSRIAALSVSVPLAFNYSLPPASICLFFFAFISTPCLWDLYVPDAMFFRQFVLISGQLLVSFSFNGRIPRSLRQVLNPWYRGWIQECGASGDFTWVRQQLLGSVLFSTIKEHQLRLLCTVLRNPELNPVQLYDPGSRLDNLNWPVCSLIWSQNTNSDYQIIQTFKRLQLLTIIHILATLGVDKD